MNTMLCIPRIEDTKPKQHIFNIFKKINWGYIEYIREMPLINEPGFKRLVIKMKFNNKSSEIQNKITNGETIKLVYDFPWYFRITKFIQK